MNLPHMKPHIIYSCMRKRLWSHGPPHSHQMRLSDMLVMIISVGTKKGK